MLMEFPNFKHKTFSNWGCCSIKKLEIFFILKKSAIFFYIIINKKVFSQKCLLSTFSLADDIILKITRKIVIRSL